MTKYVKQEMNDLNQTGEKSFYYRMEIARNIGMTEFVRSLALPGSGISEGSVMHVIYAMADRLAYYMSNGNSVTIDGIGTFKATLGLRDDKEMDTLDGEDPKRNARSIRVDGVNFKTACELVRRTNKQCRLVRGKTHRLKESPYTQDQRLALAWQYLDTHTVMRIADYVQITGLSHSFAAKELQTFRKTPESGITTSGCGTHKVYVRNRK